MKAAILCFCLLLAGSFLVVLGKTPVHAAQDRPNKGSDEDKTLFLVARPELGDPFFKESVVLMFPPSVVAVKGLVVGLIVNRPASVALSEIFPDDDALKNRSETAYFGGPVDPLATGVVFRSSKPVKKAALLFGDIYVTFDPDFIKELLEKPQETPDFRLFVGRSQWVSAQLQDEMAKKAWYSVRAETNLIFSASPKSLWRNLLERAEPPNVAKVSGVGPKLFGDKEWQAHYQKIVPLWNLAIARCLHSSSELRQSLPFQSQFPRSPFHRTWPCR